MSQRSEGVREGLHLISNMKNFINGVLSHFDLRVTRASSHKKLLNASSQFPRYRLIETMDQSDLKIFSENIEYSKSQIGQDLFVLGQLGFKTGGYFVEFGAANGVDLSNTYLLEKHFNWSGILAEPGRENLSALSKSRSVHLETNCVWSRSNEILEFTEVGDLSTISAFSGSDFHKAARRKGRRYKVSTISLLDMLEKYNAPTIIDYLSIDTEGSEFEILSAFDFEKYKFRIITCEHNFTENREKIYKLLTDRGYLRSFVGYSDFDDWYVLKSE